MPQMKAIQVSEFGDPDVLEHVDVKRPSSGEGEVVLVHAAAGGVGTLAVQMAKLMGASPVIATASTQEKLNLANELGADILINYTEEDWPEKVREATGGEGADLILEMVGADFV